MNHALLMRRRQARAQLTRDIDRLVRRQPANPAEERRQILAIDVFHREKRLALELADVVDPADVGMGDEARGTHLAAEALEPLLVAPEINRKKLESHRLAEDEIVGSVDLAHAAASEQRDDPVAAGDRGARRKSSAGGERRRGRCGNPGNCRSEAWGIGHRRTVA